MVGTTIPDYMQREKKKLGWRISELRRQPRAPELPGQCPSLPNPPPKACAISLTEAWPRPSPTSLADHIPHSQAGAQLGPARQGQRGQRGRSKHLPVLLGGPWCQGVLRDPGCPAEKNKGDLSPSLASFVLYGSLRRV